MKLDHAYYVYILECKDWSYYIGVTNDIENRLLQHNTGYDESCYTYIRQPVELKYFETFTDITRQ